jgi:hypothetical protein
MNSQKQISPLGVVPSPLSRSPFVANVNTDTRQARAVRPAAYSVEKLLALETYTEKTSAWRVAGVMVLTPIPALVFALIPAFVPMQDPLAPGGLFANPGYVQAGYLITLIVSGGTLLHWRASANIPPHVYTGCQLILVAMLCATIQFSFAVMVILMWRFPMPMSWIVASSALSTSLAIGHLVVFRERCWRDMQLVNGIKRYIPALSIQALQIVIYPAFSVLFDNCTPVYQVLLTLAFPLIKYFMKKVLRKFTHELKDFSSEVAVTGIEICASLYQSMILQNTPSQVALIVIMAIDVVQGLVVVKFFMDRPSRTQQNLIVRDALEELKASKQPTDSDGTGWVWQAQVQLPGHSVVPSPASPPAEGTKLTDGTQRQASTSKLSPVITEALELVAVAESILLVEYLEVAIPLVNAVFIAVACQFNGAQYNTRLRRLYFQPQAFASAIQSIVFYSFLQALSFIAMHLVMRHRYGLSAAYHLAFVLELHWQSIVGKMIGWLPIILHFTGIHYGPCCLTALCAWWRTDDVVWLLGVDFSFRFDFAAMLRNDNAR